MGLKLKTEEEPRRKPPKKSNKKQKEEKTSISEVVLPDTCDHRQGNEEHQNLPTIEENKAPRAGSGKIKFSETGKKRVKREKPAATVKQKKKSARGKDNILPQKVPSEHGNASPPRRPSSSSSQEYGSELSALDAVSVSENQDTQQSYQAASPKKKRRYTSKRGVVRRSKNPSKRNSPAREEYPSNKKAEVASQKTEYNRDSPEVERNDSSKQIEVRNNRKESPGRRRHEGNERSRSPGNCDREENDSDSKPRRARKGSRKRSPGSANKTRSSSNNNDEERKSKKIRSSETNRRVSPKPHHRRNAKHGTLEKQYSEETAIKRDRSPSRLSKKNHDAPQPNLPQRGTKRKAARSRSPSPAFRSSKTRKVSNKPKRPLKRRRGSKRSGKKAPPGKRTLPSKSRKETKAKTKSRVRKTVGRSIIRIRKSRVRKSITRRRSQKSYARRKK